MALEEDEGIEIPEWVVTFGDMMSLLLTFFIMLVSLSEIKEEERFQALVESFRQQFGHEASMNSMAPGRLKPRNSMLNSLATTGRAKRKDTMKGGAKVEDPVGENKRVVTVRPGQHAAIATLLVYDESEFELSNKHSDGLREIARMIDGKPQKVEIRGHTSKLPINSSQSFDDRWHLAYLRSRNVMKYLVEELNIDKNKIRISVAGANEPMHIGTDPEKMKFNSRVEVFLLEEVTSDFTGTEAERQERFVTPPPS
jgi:chemotaxis protein MotB